MRKELKDLQGCLCEQEEDTEVLLSDDGNYGDDYTYLEATKDKFGLTLAAYGEGTVYYKPMYCPFCGRHLRFKGDNKGGRK